MVRLGPIKNLTVWQIFIFHISFTRMAECFPVSATELEALPGRAIGMVLGRVREVKMCEAQVTTDQWTDIFTELLSRGRKSRLQHFQVRCYSSYSYLNICSHF